MPIAGFESTIPVFKRAKIFHALDRAAAVTGVLKNLLHQISEQVEYRSVQPKGNINARNS
jgi:hypothetical protein